MVAVHSDGSTIPASSTRHIDENGRLNEFFLLIVDGFFSNDNDAVSDSSKETCLLQVIFIIGSCCLFGDLMDFVFLYRENIHQSSNLTS